MGRRRNIEAVEKTQPKDLEPEHRFRQLQVRLAEVNNKRRELDAAEYQIRKELAELMSPFKVRDIIDTKGIRSVVVAVMQKDGDPWFMLKTRRIAKDGSLYVTDTRTHGELSVPTGEVWEKEIY